MKRPKGLRLGMLLVVEWLDAVTEESGWETHDDEPPKPELVRSVGTLIGNNDKALALAGDASRKHKRGDHVNRVLTVPWGMVTSVRQIVANECRRLA